MAILSFKVQADYEKVVRLREEIIRLENQLKSFGRNTPLIEIKAVEAKLAETRTEFTSLATEAAKAGAVLSTDFKGRIHAASQTVNSLTEKIIEQKAVIRNVEFDVKKLADAYRSALKGSNTSGASEIKADLDAARKALNEEKAALFGLTQEKAKASLETKKLKDEYAAFKEEAGETKKANDGFTLSLGKIAGLVGGAAALKQLGSAIVQVRGQFQDMETAISTLVGQDMADRLMPQLKEMAKVSPLTMTDIVGAEKMMLGFNIEADKTIDYLKALSDVSMGSSQKFNSLTLAFSQMSAAGKLMGQDLNQMINAGFNPLQVISEKTGKSIAQLKEEMSKGAVSAEMVQQAFLDATSAGGKFYNMSENASKTINGQISMMQDAMDSVFNEIGTKTEGVIVKGIKAATSLIQNYEKIGKVLVGLVATYGAYRTAVLLSTAATSKHTIAEIALTNVRIAARKAQQALNAAMLTNPYVALATVVAGLAATMWTLRDSTSAAERAQKDFDSRKEEAARKEQEHRNAIQGLIDTARDDVNATREREAALVALKNEYPNIFNEYDIESLKLANLIDLNKALNEEMNRRKKAEAAGGIAYQESLIKQLEGLGVSDKRLDTEREKLRLLQADYLKQYSLPDYISSLKGMDMAQLQKELGGAQHMASGSGVGVFDGMQADKQFYEDMVKAIETEIAGRNKTVTTYAQDYEAARKKYEEDLAAFKYAEEHKTEITTEEYRKRKTAKETSEKEFKRLGGNPKGKTESDAVKTYNENLAQQEKVAQAEAKSAKDRARTAKDMEFMVEQARIDAMREGSEKVRAQRTLDNAKELENLERQKQDYIDKAVEQEKAVFDAREEQKAKNDKKYKKQTFDSEAARSKVDTTTYDKVIGYTKEKQEQQTDEVLENLLNKYKSYEDRKQEITIAYLEESDELEAMYSETGDERYRRSLDERHKAYKKALAALEEEMGTADYKLIFGDTDKMTSGTIEKALETARKKMAELDKEADPETFKALSEAIEKLEDARDSNPFKGWETSVMGLVQILYRIRNIRKDIAKYEKEGNKDALEASKAQQEAARKDLASALAGIGVSAFGDALSNAAASMREVAEASGDIDLEKQAEALEKAGSFLSSVAAGAASGGWVGAIIGGATSLMDMLISSITESKVVAAEAKKAYEDYVDELARAKRTIDEDDYDTIFGVRSLEKVIAASRAAKDAYQDYISAMDVERGNAQSGRGYARGLENIGTSFPAERGEGVATLREMFPEMFEYTQNARGGYDVSGLKLDEAKLVLEAYSQFSSEQWYEMLSDAVEALEDYEANLKIVDDYINSLFSDLGTTLADAIMQGDDALDALRQSTGEIFASIAKQLVTELMISDDFITRYKERWRAAMSTSDLTDDADVVADMTSELEGNIAAAQSMWDSIKKMAEDRGIDMDFGESDSQQTASRKGYETLSEDTGNELVGRAVAQYESNLRMEESMRAVKDSVDIMSAGQVQIRDIAAESRAIIADSFLELQQIRENTGAIIKPINEMNQRTKDWDNIIRSL